MTKLEKAIRKIIYDCLRLKQTESVLILIDAPYRDLGELFLKSASRVCKNSVLLEMTLLKHDNQEPPPVIKNLMCQINANIILTSASLNHTRTLRTVCHHGARVLDLSKLTPEIIQRSLNTDFDFIFEKSNRIADLLSIGKTITVTSSAGTKLTIPIARKKGIADTGRTDEPGIFTTLPAGEACIAPESNKVEGVIIIDGSLGPLGLIHDPVELKIKEGCITKIIGNEEASILRKALKPFGKEARKLGEFGIGTNPKAEITGESLEDEKALGSVHVAIGDYLFEGGSFGKNCHIDAILRNPNLQIDGRSIIMNGQLLI
ncbi:hypothetical protein GF337_08480 [candidate division KSB1 bacterium]|nr:hypothetical protein [candidate division KSB1 bacterium]